MLRSSVVVFAALLAIIFLKAKLFKHHILSILAVVAGLAFVGLSEALGGSDGNVKRTSSLVILGISL
jgi:drug/metabolite transporter (DMT)-like permease